MAHFFASLADLPTRTLEHLGSAAELIGESLDRLFYRGSKPNGVSNPIGVLFRLVVLCLYVVGSMFIGGVVGLLTGGVRGLFTGIADGFWVSAFGSSLGNPLRL